MLGQQLKQLTILQSQTQMTNHLLGHYIKHCLMGKGGPGPKERAWSIACAWQSLVRLYRD